MKREELFEYRNNKEWIEKRKENIEKEYESIQKMIVRYNRYSKSNFWAQDKVGENLEILLNMKIEALNFAIKLESDLNKIDHALLKMEEPYRNILTDMYVNGNSLVSVANHMNCNYEEMRTQYGKALKMYEKL